MVACRPGGCRQPQWLHKQGLRRGWEVVRVRVFKSLPVSRLFSLLFITAGLRTLDLEGRSFLTKRGEGSSRVGPLSLGRARDNPVMDIVPSKSLSLSLSLSLPGRGS